MKAALALLAFAATVIVVSANIRPRPPIPPYINRPPNPFKPRWKREANPGDHGSVSLTQIKPLSGAERRPTYNLDYQHNIYNGKQGQITAGGGGTRLPGGRIEPTFGAHATWRFKREANPGDHGSVSLTQIKPLSGAERRPTYNLDYQHNIYNGKQGQITAGGGGTRLPGGRVEPTFGAHATWRFKREANPGDHGSVSLTQIKPLSGAERRPTYNLDYQHNIYNGKQGQITAGGGGTRLPGGRVEPTFGAHATWRFKREANPGDHGSVSLTQIKPLSGAERRPTYNLDYQHNIYNGKQGQITAGGGGTRLPGGRVEPTFGAHATWRFKREANPGDHGSVSLTQIKPLSGAERRPTYNLDYQHNIYNGKQGQITAGGGGTRLPGGRVEPTFGAHATWRFKREANPGDHGSVSLTQIKPLSGAERRPTYNLDYQHNIYNGKQGQITAGGGGTRLPGGRVEPTFGAHATWRFKREASPQHGHVSVTGNKNLSGPERRPSWNVDYQHNIWQGKNGQVTAGGGAQKLPGQRWEPTVGVQGSWRFKREANPDGPNGNIRFTAAKPLGGPERRPTYNLDIQRNFYSGKQGQFSAGGGAMRLPGGKIVPSLGATFRF